MAHHKVVARGGAGLIYGHVPLLAADFSDNQERVVTFFSGPMAGQPITLQNVYRFSGSSVNSSILTDPNSSPRTFTWNLETEITLWPNVDIRVGYFETHTVNLFVVDPILPTTGTNGFLTLQDGGSSHYRQAQMIVHYRPSERAELNLSCYLEQRGARRLEHAFRYLHPGSRSCDPPERLRRRVFRHSKPGPLLWGYVTLPWKLVASPVVDIHSGFPYSNVDIFQNYVGMPNSVRFPIYFSMDVKLYRDFSVRIPFKDHSKHRRVRVGVYSLDVTNRRNPHDVFSNVTSPLSASLPDYNAASPALPSTLANKYFTFFEISSSLG